MKKILLAILMVALFNSVAFAAATSTPKKTGKVFFRKENLKSTEKAYYTKECGKDNWVKDVSVGTLIQYNEKTHWFELPVKDALADADTMFCIYTDDDGRIYANVRPYDFNEYEDLYIINGNKYYKYSEIKQPQVFLSIPEEWNYVRGSGDLILKEDAVDGWLHIPSNDIIYRNIKYAIDSSSFKDSAITRTHLKKDIIYCNGITNVSDEKLQMYYKECAILKSKCDTLKVTQPDSADFIRYTVRVRHIEKIGSIEDTTYDDIDFFLNELKGQCQNYPGWCDRIVDTVKIDSLEMSRYEDEIRYSIQCIESVRVLDTVHIDTLASSSLAYKYDYTYDTTFTEKTYSKGALEKNSALKEGVADTVKIDSTDWFITKDVEDIRYTLSYRSIDTLERIVDAYSDYTFLFTNTEIYNNSMCISGPKYNAYSSNRDYFHINDFKGDSVYIFEDPMNAGKTMVTYKKPEIKILYVKLPFNTDWFSASPMLSFDNGKTGKLMNAITEWCGWYKIAFVSEDVSPKSALIYSAIDSSLYQGLKPESDKAFGLKDLFKKGDTVYLDAVKGIYSATAPSKVDSVCRVMLTGIIYDTDVSLNPFFSVFNDSVYHKTDFVEGQRNEFTEACLGIHQGIVRDTLDKNRKPILNKGSKNAKTCFNDDENAFNSLFNYTKGVNEGSCYSFELYQWSDSRWGFSSDYLSFGGLAGGFFPLENKVDSNVFTDTLYAARTKHLADGPVVAQSIPNGNGSFEKLCNSSSWSGGVDCEGLFITDEPEIVIWDWETSPNNESRWVDELRNTHFCFESHASFTYKKGQNFSAIGDDDVWVFIAGKLAIDNGGTHLSAPGYVDLANFTDKDGKKLVEGKTYDFDMFFCDRRTKMSNMTLLTNIYFTQKDKAKLLDPCKVHDTDKFFRDSSYVKPDSTKGGKGKIGLLASASVDHFVVMPYERTLQIARGTPGATFAIFDMQGNMVRKGELSPGITNVSMPNAGSYIVKVGSRTKMFSVK